MPGRTEISDHATGGHAVGLANGRGSRRVTIGRAASGRLTLGEVEAVARGNGVRVSIAESALAHVRAARAFVHTIAEENRTVYGITTGFGHLSRVKIAPDQLAELQRNLLRSHASGTGEPLDIPTVRAMLLLLANSLARGHSGASVELLELLVALLNRGVTPVVPSRGSVGASGDLAPLAHLGLVLISEGEAYFAGERLPGGEALRRADLHAHLLGAKEGLALINGTHMMEACGALALADAWRLLRAAEVAAAMSTEALLGSHVPLDARIHALRPQAGQPRTAARLRALLAGSEINLSHADCGRVQDPYTLRCVPQVLGAARDALTYCGQVFEAELGAVTDNPLIFAEDGDVLTGGNFHGQPLALALDFLGVALAQVASFSERRTYNVVGPHDWEAQLWLHDRPIRRRRAGQRDQNARPSRQHRFDPHLCRHGRLREHGRDGGAQAAPAARPGLPCGRRRAALRRAGAGLPPAAAGGPRGRAGASGRAARRAASRRGPPARAGYRGAGRGAARRSAGGPGARGNASPPKRSHRANGAGGRRAAADAGDAAGTARH